MGINLNIIANNKSRNTIENTIGNFFFFLMYKFMMSKEEG